MPWRPNIYIFVHHIFRCYSAPTNLTFLWIREMSSNDKVYSFNSTSFRKLIFSTSWIWFHTEKCSVVQTKVAFKTYRNYSSLRPQFVLRYEYSPNIFNPFEGWIFLKNNKNDFFKNIKSFKRRDNYRRHVKKMRLV